ncbi:hypothetical protein ElyMa_007044400 [Elysia marginata]|uniref:Tyrosine-protein kinase ephrin type A/B receptor-like domain-containing protein n=1 Tax=Elysia marginata TaxID=1093978 RepID=A0AAV4JWL9_9GAST|nr:hypothetical protein ElyMa_007044400 [Elysia marginata]
MQPTESEIFIIISAVVSVFCFPEAVSKLRVRPSRSLIRHCVNLPQIPLAGMFTMKGSFRATLKCSDPKQDISLNAPGYRGVLMCDPHSDFHFDFRNLWKPDCHPRKMPAKIRTKARFVYMISQCSGKVRTDAESSITDRFQQYVESVNDPCGAGQTVCLVNVQFSCGTSGDGVTSGLAYQLEAHFSLTTNYVISNNLQFYTNVTQDIRRRLGCDWRGYLEQAQHAMWHIDNTHLVFVSVSSWKGTCEEYANSLGTDLEVDGVLTCRGCSEKYFMSNDKCKPCKYDEYSRPFSSKCAPCPSEILWTDRLRMEDLCYIRP